MHPTDYFNTKDKENLDLGQVDALVEYIYDCHGLVDLELVPVTNALQSLAKEVKRLRKEIADYKADDALWWNNHHE